jgi:hypothetical protein
MKGIELNQGIRQVGFVIILSFVLVSCTPLDVRNEQRFSDVISIVTEDKDIKNSFATFSLDIKPEGDWGIASYMVDFENQPANTPPFQARLISWDKRDTSAFRYMPEVIDSTYKDTLLSISSVLNLDHFMFITATQRALRDDVYSYELVCKVDSFITMYLNAKLDSRGIDTIRVERKPLIAFNISPLWDEQIAQGNDSIIRFNLKYSSRTDSIRYSPYKNNPIKLQVTNINK